MPKVDQLEIIAPDGKTYFHGLDTQKGVTNIGRHPDNDIVIESPSIGQFQAVLDHQRKPFRFMLLSKEAAARLAGQPLEPHVFSEIRDWQTVELDGYSLTLLENMEIPDGITLAATLQPVVVSASPAPPVPSTLTPAAPVAAALASIAVLFPTRPTDSLDDAIVGSISEREATVDVDQPAIFEITVANGGPIVAEFEMMVEGIDPGWVTITPPQIFLNEGARASARITILPPRQPQTTAGVHHLAVVIISPNYPGHATRLGVSLEINPYYEFTVSPLSPQRQNAGWSQRSAQAGFSIQNQGNTPTTFQVLAQDDENGLRFEYILNEKGNIPRQAEVKVRPAETAPVQVVITPLKRSLVRVRARQYPYSVTVQSLNEPGAARIISGAFTSRPLFGPISILMAVILLLTGIFFMFRPRLDNFNVTPVVVAAGQPVTLSWQAPLFTNEISLKNLPDAIKPGVNQVALVPTDTLTTYTLIGRNWLSRLLSLPDTTLTSQAVLAIPPMPQITTFLVDKTDVILGQSVNLKYAVSNATSVVLTVENVPVTLALAEFSGEKTLTLTKNSLIVIEARNASGSVVQSEYVRVWGPSDLKVDFKVDPPQVTAGNPVNVSWDVSGSGFTVDTVTVAPFNEPLPAKFSLQFYPTESMYFVLKVKVRDYELSVPKYVTVLPADAKPIIDYFKATPPNLSSSGSVEFSWSVSGSADSIEISDKTGVVKKSLPPQGFLNLVVSQSATYVMTAKKGSQSTSATAEVQVTNLAEVNITITSIVPQSGILRGDSIFVYFSIAPKVVVTNGPEVSGSVVVTDGFDSCEVKLPITSCTLIFHRSGTDKKLVATYSGDGSFKRTTSAPFPKDSTITVIGSTVAAKNINITYTPPLIPPAVQQNHIPSALPTSGPMVGQTGYLQFDLIPIGGASLSPVQGVFDLLVNDLTTNVTSTLCVDQPLVVGLAVDGSNVGRGYCQFLFASAGDRQFTIKYRGNEIYEPLTTDPTDPNLSSLLVSVGQAVTRINLLSQNPARSAQVGQLVSLTLQVMVDATGGNPVPGVGTLSIGDSLNNLCSAPINAQGTVICAFTAIQSVTNLVISYTGNENYLSSNNSGTTSIRYEITKALVDVLISAIQFPNVTPGQVNPMVGQTINVVLNVRTTTFNTGVNFGTVLVFLLDSANPTATTPACSIPLPETIVQCSILVAHGGSNKIMTTYSDTTNHYQSNTTENKTQPVSPAPVTIQNISPSVPSAVEGGTINVAFKVVPDFVTSLVPAGTFNIRTDAEEAPCSGTLPAQNSCNLTITANAASQRSILVNFGDGVDYLITSASLSNYPVLHKTTATILSNQPTSPAAFSSIVVAFSVTPFYQNVTGMPVPAGNVTASIAGSPAKTCTGALDATGQGSCTISNLEAGAFNLQAAYDPQSYPFEASTSADFPLKVDRVETTLVLQSQTPAPSYLKGSATFTLAPGGSGPVPTGTAVISARKADGSTGNSLTEVCQNVVQLVIGGWSCSIIFNTAGVWDLYYTYSGDSSYNPVTTLQSLNATHVVIKYPTDIIITDAVQVKNTTQVQVTYQVKKQLVNNITLSDSITGMVTIDIVGSSPALSCTGPINYNKTTGIGTGSCLILFPTGGGATYNAVASYSGDNSFDISTSNPFTITVQ
jgi:hypothetical protein